MQNLRSRAVLLGTLGLVIVLGLILDELGALAPVEGILLQLTTPVQRLVDSLTERAVSASTALRDLRDLRAQNERLESLVDSLMVENVRLKEVEAQNEDLRKKLAFKEAYPQYVLKAAEVRGRVIGYEPNNFMSVLIIDIGTRDGILKGMPVVEERGLVGHVHQVGTNWAKVLLIVDPSSSVVVLVQSSRAPGVVSGHLGQELIMDYIPQDASISVGDVILTSGMGGSYPRQLVVGQVTEVEQRDIDPFQRAVVSPSVNFDKLETVLVITSFEAVDVQGALDDEGATEGEDTPAAKDTPAADGTPGAEGTPTP
ncbi:MAG: rod shape-determining protein MreC [Anaerolineae bacterium]|nr:rod shape-determining protein MreC [Anaerolineae bacterium]